MCDIKDKFITEVLKDLYGHKPRISKRRQDEIAEERWQIFLEHFINNPPNDNYVKGQWI